MSYLDNLNPIAQEALFDSILLAGVFSPGVVTISGHKRVQKYDVKEADGSAGASVTRKGESLSEFTCTFKLSIDPVLGIDDFAAWDDFLLLLKSCTAKKDPVALAIYHPDLMALDIGNVVPKEIGGLQHDGKGGATVSVVFLEYLAPKPKSGSPKPKGGKADPNADIKKQIDEELKKAQASP